MNTILTLCHKCAGLMAEGYRVKEISRTTTERKKVCEKCGSRGYLLQYHVQSRGGRK